MGLFPEFGVRCDDLVLIGVLLANTHGEDGDIGFGTEETRPHPSDFFQDEVLFIRDLFFRQTIPPPSFHHRW